MKRIARIIPASSLWVVFLISPAGVQAQEPLFEVERSDAKLLRVNDDAGLLVGGTLGAGRIPATGAGVRLMWYPKVGSLRAGSVDGSHWDEANVGRSSAAFGENTIASGTYSTAWGSLTTAAGTGSGALGGESEATGAYSLAAGLGAKATGERTVALGERTTASGLVATAIGFQTTASGTTSTAMGTGTSATGGASTAMGSRTLASADYSTAMGSGTKATGNYSTAMGFETQASGISSTAIGAASTAAGLGSVAMGTRAIAQGAGSFAFADRSSTEPYTALENQFVVRAHGGIGFNSGTNIGCDLPAGVGAWACTSSRLAKEGFEEVDGETVLAKLARIPIQRWSYLGTPAMHVGPMAEDFHGAFGLGEGPTTITTVDADGIALLGVQTLERRTAELRVENADLLRRVETLESTSRCVSPEPLNPRMSIP
jgi:Head domain of trimeric autotransporter adhesin